MFQSRNREAFHFRVSPVSPVLQRRYIVSISQSRGFSFQVEKRADARGCRYVSISQSRGFSFQDGYDQDDRFAYLRFNLAIERLFISGTPTGFTGGNYTMFQSRNREAFPFRCRHFAEPIYESPGFNLAIERLFSSGLDADVNLDIQVSFQSRNRDAFQFRIKA